MYGVQGAQEPVARQVLVLEEAEVVASSSGSCLLLHAAQLKQ
jgi:hypothetical protein